METQLRIYTVAAGHHDDFLRAWLTGVLPLRRAFGFEVDAWTQVHNDDRFIWLIRYGGPDSFAEADARYYASRERAERDPDPAQWVVDSETYDLTEVGVPPTDG